MSGVVELVRAVEGLAAVVWRAELAGSSAGAASSLWAGVDWSTVNIKGPLRGLCASRSSAGSARNCLFAVVGAGFEEVELLDAVDYGGPQRSSCGPVSRRIRLMVDAGNRTRTP